MKKTIYLDMDGVVADFERHYEDLFGVLPSQTREWRGIKVFEDNWDQFIADDQFCFLPKMPDCDQLVDYLLTLNADIMMLSSTARERSHKQVQRQKLIWLDQNGIDWPAILVPGKRFKKGFASPNSILIDDTAKNITDFNQAGGIGILHRSAVETIQQLRVIFEKELEHES